MEWEVERKCNKKVMKEDREKVVRETREVRESSIRK